MFGCDFERQRGLACRLGSQALPPGRLPKLNSANTRSMLVTASCGWRSATSAVFNLLQEFY